MFEFITEFLEKSGYLGVFALMALENIFPPIPSEMIMPFAGFVVARGDLNLVGVLLAGTAGSVAGALPWYYAAKVYGCERLKRIAGGSHARWLTVTPDDIDTALESFRKHGRKAVLFGRLIPAVRTLISVPAGLGNMSLGQFLLYSSIGSLAWTGLLTAAGFLLENNYKEVATYVDPVSKAVLGAMLAWYLYRVITWRKPAQAGSRKQEAEMN
ncbi:MULTISPECIES: DedA family protein [unclassified Massilia]|uniref:DedA family protein n=1 Tax=unclassified Massilia TaxID=2609279 RepID=UPI00177FAB49|nr:MULTISPECIES: DedA family protein [unclassified Massilia]MBD8531281.1 DedA family protein [Massilia sp. CFBP 13647]MBD8675918.1 DedA family protein [Massilia sp. CFBP 13721]